LCKAPRAWHAKLAADVATFGYTSFQHPESTFLRDKDNIKVFLLIYFDVLLILVSLHADAVVEYMFASDAQSLLAIAAMQRCHRFVDYMSGVTNVTVTCAETFLEAPPVMYVVIHLL
jgi:hypothetical protein